MSEILIEGTVKNRGWRVTIAGLGINLALGILYTWSVISRGVPDDWGWSQSDKSWPYAVADPSPTAAARSQDARADSRQAMPLLPTTLQGGHLVTHLACRPGIVPGRLLHVAGRADLR